MTRRRNRRAARARLLVLLATLLALGLIAGCAGIPSSSSPRLVRKIADEVDASVPQGPEPGQQPEQIVREFIHDMALTEYDPPGSQSFVAARGFLTPAARKSWSADSGSTPVIVLSSAFDAKQDPDHPGWVTVSGTQIGELREDRSYRPVDSVPYSVTMHLVKSAGQWRISDPPAKVLLTQDDFTPTAFRQRAVYFLDASGRVVVPDIRYIPNAPTAELSANRLMDLLIQGPSSQLAGAARTQLGKGAQLLKNVQVDSSGVAHVDLENVDVSTPAARQALAAQIVWTLDPDVPQVAITVNGLPLDAGSTAGSDSAAASATGPGTIYSLSSGTLNNFSPDVVPGSAQAVSDAYYIDEGKILRLSDSTAMWGDVGTGSVDVLSASLSAATGALAAVARNPDGGQQLLVGRPFDYQFPVTVLKASTLTKPSFTRWGYAAWTVQNGAKQPEIYQVTITTGAPTWSRVAAPDLAGKGPVTELQLSPDGVRVAIVAGGKLYLGVIASAPGSSAASASSSAEPDSDASDRLGLQVTGLHVLRNDLTDVGPVAWKDSTSLLVGAKSGGSSYRTVYDVSVDGQSADPVTTLMTFGAVFGDVDAIATFSPDLPMLISFGGHVWKLQGTETSGRWVSPSTNWLTGTSPFYPN